VFFLRRPPAAPPTAAPAPPGPDLLAEAAADAAATLTRADARSAAQGQVAGVLLGALLAAATLTGRSAPPAALVAMALCGALLLGALGTILGTLTPSHRGTGGVPYYAQLSAEQIRAELEGAEAAAYHAERVAVLSRIAVRRHRWQRLAALLVLLASAAFGAALAAVLLTT
jgi:hypothetical protein